MKRHSAPDSSLELLLDTICNTFGGVLFLAILVCVLLRNTGHGEGQASGEPLATEADVLELVRLQEEATVALSSLRSAVAEQERLLKQFAAPETGALLDALLLRQAEREELDNKRRKGLAEIAATSANIVNLERGMEELDRSLSAARTKAAAAETALQSELAAHSADAHLPRERISGKREVGFVIRYHRLYQWLRYDKDGYPDGLNTDEFVVVEDTATGLVTLPKPYAGVRLDDDQAASEVAQRFARFDRQKIHLTFVTWDDSFDVFQRVKAISVKGGFEYRIVTMSEGDSLSDRGGTDGRVQ